MNTAFRYWRLVRLDSAGRCRTQTLAPVQTWLRATFSGVIDAPEGADQQLLTALVEVYRAPGAEAELAQLSLRCYISHQIRQVCLQLAHQFGEHYGFNAADLFPLVLDDDGQRSPQYRPLSLEILDTYDPTKAQLNTWTARLVKTHPDLDRALLERGLYRASDWAILNDTRTDQLQRILRQYHLCSDAEIALASQLLQRYHQVYLTARIEQYRAGKRGRCRPPTPEQLKRIDPQHEASDVLLRLKQLAAQLRQYRIHARGGNVTLYNRDFPIDQGWAPPAEDDADQAAFLATYQQVLRESLDAVLTQVIQTQVTRLQMRTPPKDQAYVQGLRLFHCVGLAMGKLAPQIGLSTQVQVNRLLQLKRLRADVRYLLIPQLVERVRSQALDYVSAEQLQQIDRTLEHLLTENVDQLIGEAASEAQAPQRTGKSLFAHRLCQTIHRFIPNHA
ncbi:hypothetical protein IQ254_05615 [Nodosilinea sp. LEGE 07088]|uniref:hypothetical protein n=1 Tax=Nodosilinea sp. LEGE 07088 TaxID=2777968 RepID=UPI001881D350|nr:hypothetical protein [Nodosilinea sp. LEGE 07088]MBE9136683.1 hypothetical protein [Nodosilinea sp. LEGE 07088]